MEGWLGRNLETQGYCFSDAERRALRVGLRFSTGLCLPIVAVGLALESIPLLLVSVALALLAGFTPRHPFDYLWNRVVRHALGAAPLPPNPQRRRDAFKVGAALLAILVALFAVGADTVALILGATLLVACLSVTALNLCLRSETFALLDRLRRQPQARST
jgi:Domain of unknown function (DUF4395)